MTQAAENRLIHNEHGIDYVLVRPMGLAPEEPPRGKWATIRQEDPKGKVGMTIAKSDVAQFMLREALLEPTATRTMVTIGGAPKEEPPPKED